MGCGCFGACGCGEDFGDWGNSSMKVYNDEMKATVVPAVEECNGDKTLGYDFNAKCYASGSCEGCEACTLVCPGCANCAPRKLGRDLEVSDYVYVEKKVAAKGKGKWTKKIDQAVGRVAWIKTGDPLKGFILKFSPETPTIEKFLFPSASLRLATTEDVQVSNMIHSLKDQKGN